MGIKTINQKLRAPHSWTIDFSTHQPKCLSLEATSSRSSSPSSCRPSVSSSSADAVPTSSSTSCLPSWVTSPVSSTPCTSSSNTRCRLALSTREPSGSRHDLTAGGCLIPNDTHPNQPTPQKQTNPPFSVGCNE